MYRNWITVLTRKQWHKAKKALEEANYLDEDLFLTKEGFLTKTEAIRKGYYLVY